MVIVKLIGGLGNQMFQYAVGRGLAHKLGVELKLDISAFVNHEMRKYSLGIFNIKENFASPKEILKLTVAYPGTIERMARWILDRRAGPRQLPSFIREKKKCFFDPDILNLTGEVFLEGYWQSEKYFCDIDGIIRQEFTEKTSLTLKSKEFLRQIVSCESVNIHIRRGDYVSNPRTNAHHGTCSLDYYHRSVERITQAVKSPHFFVFSDEPEWACDNLKLDYQTTYIDHNGEDKDYEDLHLMSQCKYHIMANSSFSWWGAWLSNYPDKIVIAPKKWFNDYPTDTCDLCPEDWIRL